MNSRFYQANASHITVIFGAQDGNIERLKAWIEQIWHEIGAQAFQRNQINIRSVVEDVKIFDFAKTPSDTLGVKIETFATDNREKELWEATVLNMTDLIVAQSKSFAIVTFNNGRTISFSHAP